MPPLNLPCLTPRHTFLIVLLQSLFVTFPSLSCARSPSDFPYLSTLSHFSPHSPVTTPGLPQRRWMHCLRFSATCWHESDSCREW